VCWLNLSGPVIVTTCTSPQAFVAWHPLFRLFVHYVWLQQQLRHRAVTNVDVLTCCQQSVHSCHGVKSQQSCRCVTCQHMSNTMMVLAVTATVPGTLPGGQPLLPRAAPSRCWHCQWLCRQHSCSCFIKAADTCLYTNQHFRSRFSLVTGLSQGISDHLV
jgi:hypothetical protein